MSVETPLLEFEEQAYSQGFQTIAGVDEVGRGPLAGPVVAAACILPRGLIIDGIDDSKKLTPEQREHLYRLLVSHPHVAYALATVDHYEIDTLNILQASLRAMALAVNHLSIKPDYVLVDGNQKPPIEITTQMVIKGDALSQSIGAASILAKRSRDQMMLEYHQQWPEYGFDKHKGYATKKHLDALERYGPCPIHRQSFKPIKK